jgi:hypothetical protein
MFSNVARSHRRKIPLALMNFACHVGEHWLSHSRVRGYLTLTLKLVSPLNTITSSSSSRPDSSLSRHACLASASLLSCCFHLLSLPMVATTVCKLDVGENEVVWACACLCTGPLEGVETTPLHNLNPTSPNPNSKNSLDLWWNFWPKFGRQTFL